MTDTTPITNGEEMVLFYQELGLAITAWANVEYALILVASNCFSSNEEENVSMVFLSIENFRSKLQVVDKLVSENFREPQHKKRWKLLFDRTQTASANRNALAHMWLRIFPDNAAGRRYALVPKFPEPIKLRKGPVKPPPGSLCVRDIVSIRYEFHALIVALQNFSCEIEGMKGPFPESDEQPQSPPTTQTLARRNHAILGHPVPPSKRSLRRKVE